RPNIPEHPGTEAAADWNASHGTFRKADELWALARSEMPKDRPGFIARLSVVPLLWPALLGQCGPMEQATQRALASYRGEDFLREAGLLLGLCGDAARAQAVATEIHQGFPEGTLESGVDIPLIRAAIQLKARHPEAALDELKAALPFERAYPVVTYLRALAYLTIKSTAAAAA